MDAKRVVVAALAGAAVLHAAGNVLFRTWLVPFYVINAGSATGVDRGVQVVWAAALANLAYATLITWVLVTHRDGTSIGDGAITGAIVGFLMWLTVDFNLYSSSHIANLLRTMVDPGPRGNPRGPWGRGDRCRPSSPACGGAPDGVTYPPLQSAWTSVWSSPLDARRWPGRYTRRDSRLSSGDPRRDRAVR
jgi:hypothetical protein